MMRWSASSAVMAVHMIERPVIPTVLVVVNKDSRIELFQDQGVQVAFADERVDTHSLILLPRKNQAQELYDRLDGKIVVSPAEDHADTAANAVRQIKSLNVIATGLRAEKEAS
ncbi:MAG: hypothetical protein KKF33_15350, partial [Alphaproteobacteria bacterium]|nr:hypothetical protein [Alphaproteobacteria bacterium]